MRVRGEPLLRSEKQIIENREGLTPQAHKTSFSFWPSKIVPWADLSDGRAAAIFSMLQKIVLLWGCTVCAIRREISLLCIYRFLSTYHIGFTKHWAFGSTILPCQVWDTGETQLQECWGSGVGAEVREWCLFTPLFSPNFQSTE